MFHLCTWVISFLQPWLAVGFAVDMELNKYPSFCIMLSLTLLSYGLFPCQPTGYLPCPQRGKAPSMCVLVWHCSLKDLNNVTDTRNTPSVQTVSVSLSALFIIPDYLICMRYPRVCVTLHETKQATRKSGKSWFFPTDIKQSDVEVPVMQELWGIWSTLYCYCSQVHSGPEWWHLIGSYLWVK